jgi:hypothetical protein
MSDNQTISSTNNSLVVDRCLAYGIFRFTLGINILIHGVGRLFGLGTGEFAAKTSADGCSHRDAVREATVIARESESQSGCLSRSLQV